MTDHPADPRNRMSNWIVCKRDGRRPAAKTGGGQCLCPPERCVNEEGMTGHPAEPMTEELIEYLNSRISPRSRWVDRRYSPRDCMVDGIIRDRLVSLTAAKEAAEKQVTNWKNCYISMCKTTTQFYDKLVAAEKQVEELRQLVWDIDFWARSKCPCNNEQPDPCPLCGASVANLENCKAVDITFPSRLRDSISFALATTAPKEGT